MASASLATVLAGMLTSSAALALAPTQPRLDQARNGTAAATTSPVDFQNGNAGASNSHYIEGMSIPYRLIFPNIDPGTHTVTIEWDLRQGGLHAIDYITHYDRLQPHSVFTPSHAAESVNPLVGVAGSFDPPTTFPIPTPSTTGTPVAGQPATSFEALPAAQRVLTMFNGTITAADYVSQGSLTATQSSTRMQITFEAQGPTVVLAWGGHIASRADWGEGTSAGQINGSSYHTRLIDLDGSGGNQDRSLSATAVFAPIACVLTGPTVSCPSTTETFGSATAGASYLWEVTGDASIVGSATGPTVQVLVGTVCAGSYFVSLRQTDAVGNVTTCSRVVPIQDTTPPVITCPADIVVECGTSIDPTFTGVATAVDGCGPNVTITFGDATRAPAFAAAACEPQPPIERTWTATDDCGNTSSCVQIISFVDTTPPSLTCPPDVTVECGASIDPADTGTPTSSDTCDPNVTITFGDATRSASLALAGGCVIPSIERTWTVTDDCGNTSTCVQIINFVDTTPPEITCPPDVTLECGASVDPADTGTATATDGCNPTITITFGDASRGPALATAANGGACTIPGIDRTWTATDACGNTSTCVQRIDFVDTTPPEITCPPDVTLECGASVDPADTGTATATDGCNPNITITFGDASRGPALATAANGACTIPGIDRTWTATDACGNTSTCVQRIDFVDTTPPEITCPPDVALECGASSDPDNTGRATATDGCDPSITITFGDATRAPALRSGPVTAASCAGATIDRTWTATDDCGNTSTCVQVITFVDTAPPSIDCPTDVVRPACDNVVTWETGATDACDAAPTVSFDPPSGTAFPVGATTVTGTATDACGNTSTCSFIVTVSETKGAPITGPAAVCKGQSALLCGVEGAATYSWTGPGGFTADDPCVTVTAPGTYVLETTFTGEKCTIRSEHVLGTADAPVCSIDGPSTVCSGGKATLCGPAGNYGYAWTGPGGFTAATQCVDVGEPGTYQLVITDLETKCVSLACTHELSLGVCDLVCPRTAGFWAAQCDQAPTGQTKFNAGQMAQIAGLVDARVAIFSWPDGQDFARFCSTVSTGGSMDPRRQAKRQFAAFLANVSTGELGLVASNGIEVSLSASTAVSCDGLSSTTVGALIGEVDALLQLLDSQSLTDATVKARYSQIISCLDAINNAVGFTTVCESAAPENALYQDAPAAAGVGDRSLELRRPTPNPFTSSTRIAYEIPSGGRDAFVGVFDVAGRSVKTLVSGAASPGRHEISWDGRDDHGSRVKSGVYFVRIVTGGTARTLPVVYLDR